MVFKTSVAILSYLRGISYYRHDYTGIHAHEENNVKNAEISSNHFTLYPQVIRKMKISRDLSFRFSGITMAYPAAIFILLIIFFRFYCRGDTGVFYFIGTAVCRESPVAARLKN